MRERLADCLQNSLRGFESRRDLNSYPNYPRTAVSDSVFDYNPIRMLQYGFGNGPMSPTKFLRTLKGGMHEAEALEEDCLSGSSSGSGTRRTGLLEKESINFLKYRSSSTLLAGT